MSGADEGLGVRVRAARRGDSGLQNLYDRELDEWIVMDSFRRGAGTVTLPEECSAQPDPTATTVTPTG